MKCTHLDQVRDVIPGADYCEECLKSGGIWVSLRECLTCGYVGCCESSSGKHALKHFDATGHPIIKVLQPEDTIMRWCYLCGTPV